MKILNFPPTAGATAVPAAEEAAPELRNAVRDLLDRFYRMRCVARGLTPSSIQDRRRIVERFLADCGCPPWAVTAHHYDAWMGRLVLENRIVVTTQRTYQAAIETCFRYWQSDVALQNELRLRYGATIECPVNEDNRIAHKHPHQRIRRKTAPTRAQIAKLLRAMESLRDAYWQNPATEARGWCVERDRIAFALQYYLALRVGEIVALNVESFHEASWAPPELGPFAVADVIGKGGPCQGPKQRTVMVTDIQVRTLLEWHIEHVRPRFHSDSDEHAMFLSRAGKRLGRSHFVHFFRRYLRIAGLDSFDFSTHALRRAGLTHTAQRTGITFAQQQAGHVFLATTQDYVSVSDEEIQEQHRLAVKQTLSRILKNTKPENLASKQGIED